MSAPSKQFGDAQRDAGAIEHRRPVHGPVAVNAIADKLFAAFQVDGGRVHLGGCHLEDRPFLMLRYDEPEMAGGVQDFYVAADGSSVTDELISQLGLDDTELIDELPPRIQPHDLDMMKAAGRRFANQHWHTGDPTASAGEPSYAALIWAKYASGQLQFTIGETSEALSFAGWAALVEPQPFRCPHSGAATFHLAATDDGRIVAAGEIAVCEASGCRTLRSDLVECSVSGRHVLSSFVETCPVTGQPALKDCFENCSVCQQRVSSAAIQARVCRACRQMAPVKKDDPRLIWILGEHAGLDRWQHWRLAETQQAYIAEASSWLRRLLLVVDTETLDIRYLATRGRLSRKWEPVEGLDRDRELG